jgi:hypothetical protein
VAARTRRKLLRPIVLPGRGDETRAAGPDEEADQQEEADWQQEQRQVDADEREAATEEKGQSRLTGVRLLLS